MKFLVLVFLAFFSAALSCATKEKPNESEQKSRAIIEQVKLDMERDKQVAENQKKAAQQQQQNSRDVLERHKKEAKKK